MPQVTLWDEDFLKFCFVEQALKYKKNLKCWKFYEYKKIGYYKQQFEFCCQLFQVTPFITTE